MKRFTFTKAVIVYQGRVLRKLEAKRIDPDLARESLQVGCISVLDNKGYKSIPGDNIDKGMIAFLYVTALNAMSNILRKQKKEGEVMRPIVEEDTTFVEAKHAYRLERNDYRDPKECPFCHTPDSLNQFNACGVCHTIMGKTYPNHATGSENVSDEELLTEDDLDVKIDVQKALEKLSDIERLVIEKVVYQNETLDDIAIQVDLPRTSVHRLYVKAKAKLAVSLVEYALK